MTQTTAAAQHSFRGNSSSYKKIQCGAKVQQNLQRNSQTHWSKSSWKRHKAPTTNRKTRKQIFSWKSQNTACNPERSNLFTKLWKYSRGEVLRKNRRMPFVDRLNHISAQWQTSSSDKVWRLGGFDHRAYQTLSTGANTVFFTYFKTVFSSFTNPNIHKSTARMQIPSERVQISSQSESNTETSRSNFTIQSAKKHFLLLTDSWSNQQQINRLQRPF